MPMIARAGGNLDNPVLLSQTPDTAHWARPERHEVKTDEEDPTLS